MLKLKLLSVLLNSPYPTDPPQGRLGSGAHQTMQGFCWHPLIPSEPLLGWAWSPHHRLTRTPCSCTSVPSCAHCVPPNSLQNGIEWVAGSAISPPSTISSSFPQATFPATFQGLPPVCPSVGTCPSSDGCCRVGTHPSIREPLSQRVCHPECSPRPHPRHSRPFPWKLHPAFQRCAVTSVWAHLPLGWIFSTAQQTKLRQPLKTVWYSHTRIILDNFNYLP